MWLTTWDQSQDLHDGRRDLAPAGCPLTFVQRIKYRMAGTMEQKGKHCAATHNSYLGTEDKPLSEGLAPPHMPLTPTICVTAKPSQGPWAAILGRQLNQHSYIFPLSFKAGSVETRPVQNTLRSPCTCSNHLALASGVLGLKGVWLKTWPDMYRGKWRSLKFGRFHFLYFRVS